MSIAEISVASEKIYPLEVPFIIRGHHFFNFGRLLRTPRSPETYAHLDRGVLGTFTRMAEETNDAQLRERLLGYVADYGGKTVEEWLIFEERQKNILEGFTTLPNDYPAVLTEGFPDVICALATVGEHCRKRCTGIMKDEDVLSYDRKCLDKFLETAIELGFSELLIENRTTATFSDSPSEDVRQIFTTLGVVRAVMKEVSFFLG